MSGLSSRLVWIGAGILSFAVVTGALAVSVSYKPYGVPDSRRAEYEEAVDNIVRKRSLVKSLSESAKPVASFSDRTHDFGMIDPHTTASHAFAVTNTGDDPLTLNVEQTSCKCTVGTLRDSVLMPGDSTAVTLTWNTGQQAEEYQQSALVRTNDPIKPIVELVVRGEVRAELVAPKQVGFSKSEVAGRPKGHFIVYSQLWEDFSIEDVKSDLPYFEWIAEPESLASGALADSQPKSAWRISMTTFAEKQGVYTGQIELTIRPGNGSEAVTRKLTASGTVRRPVTFTGPDLHQTTGLEMGTVVAGKEQEFHFNARVRGDKSRTIKILDVQPSELKASLTPLQSPGNYRVTVTVPKGCATVTFNLPRKKGYVSIGDPDDKSFRNWIPLVGAVVELDQ